MSEFKLASLQEINRTHGIDIGPELAVLTSRDISLVRIRWDHLGDPIDADTSALLGELSGKGVLDLDQRALADYFVSETDAIRVRVDELVTLKGIDN